MLLPLDEDSERRRRLWVLCASPLFDFWLDVASDERDFKAVAIAASEVGYTVKDVRAIYWHEVVPAVMGSWGPMDPLDTAWLENRIGNPSHIGYWLSWLLTPWWGWAAYEIWRDIARTMDT
jgi:hypothetical protein